MIGFTVPRDGKATVQLSGLQRDADLYLTDASGDVLASSTRWGRADDSVSVSVDSGDYFVFVVAQSYWSNRYRLSIETELPPISVKVRVPSTWPIRAAVFRVDPASAWLKVVS